MGLAHRQESSLSGLFRATAEATGEAIINALFRAETVEGNGQEPGGTATA
ncbi:P1 family peptidase [Thermococcus zilligii]|nr:P1 family peptidase [Thermococcus zilligii]